MNPSISPAPDLSLPESSFNTKKKEPAPPTPHMIRLQEHFPLYGSYALLLALFSAFCFFRNPHGITYPLFTAAAYVSAWQILKSLNFPVKKTALFPAAAALFLALNSSFTASEKIHTLNNLAQILLGAFFLLHQCYDDRRWNIGKYAGSVLKLFGNAVCALPLPFLHGRRFLKTVKDSRSRNLLMLLAGFLLSLPVLFYVSLMFAKADAVFRSILQNGLAEIFRSSAIPEFLLLFLGSFFCCYCLMGSLCAGKIKESPREVSQKNPLAAISFCAMLCLLYVFFCGIQIVYLFAGKGTLPDGMTYSEYAREGFFQLLLVSFFNLVLVLAVLNYFKRHPVLTGCLAVISLCTGILLGSSAFRMCLYVAAYGLTFLRLGVLWFLALLAVLLAGILLFLFRSAFPLFRWCLVSSVLFYCAFVWSCPDLQIARWNIAREDGFITQENVSYILTSLSVDAAPAIMEAEVAPDIWDYTPPRTASRYWPSILTEKWQMICCMPGSPWYESRGRQGIAEWLDTLSENLLSWDPGIRTYNASLARAWELSLEALEESAH